MSFHLSKIYFRAYIDKVFIFLKLERENVLTFNTNSLLGMAEVLASVVADKLKLFVNVPSLTKIRQHA